MIQLFPVDWTYKCAKDSTKQHQPVKYGLLEELHPVPVCLGFKVLKKKKDSRLISSPSWVRHGQSTFNSFTFEEIVAVILQKALDVQRDEVLGSEGVSIQGGGQCKRKFQRRDQEKATGRCFSVPALNLWRTTTILLLKMFRFLSTMYLWMEEECFYLVVWKLKVFALKREAEILTSLKSIQKSWLNDSAWKTQKSSAGIQIGWLRISA